MPLQRGCGQARVGRIPKSSDCLVLFSTSLNSWTIWENVGLQHAQHGRVAALPDELGSWSVHGLLSMHVSSSAAPRHMLCQLPRSPGAQTSVAWRKRDYMAVGAHLICWSSAQQRCIRSASGAGQSGGIVGRTPAWATCAMTWKVVMPSYASSPANSSHTARGRCRSAAAMSSLVVCFPSSRRREAACVSAHVRHPEASPAAPTVPRAPFRMATLHQTQFLREGLCLSYTATSLPFPTHSGC